MRRNPFDSELNLRHSHYCLAVQRELKYTPTSPAIDQLGHEVWEELQTRIVDERYPCTGAQAAFNQEAYRLGVYPELGSAAATAGLARDLFTFVQEYRRIESDFVTFIAAFAEPTDLSEEQFEAALWDQLGKLHWVDGEYHEWDPAVSADPHDQSFGFSFGETAFFVVGMHANSSRLARRFPYPLLVFNLHHQFERLRESGAYGKMQAVIRERDRALQGSVNPMLADFGTAPAARQYSGRAVEAEWRCPFHAAVPASGDLSRRDPQPAGAGE